MMIFSDFDLNIGISGKSRDRIEKTLSFSSILNSSLIGVKVVILQVP